MGLPVVPYSAYVEMALSAVLQTGAPDCSTVTSLALHHPLFLRDHETHTVQTVLSRQSGGQFSFAVYNRPETSGAAAAKWQLCASAVIHERNPGGL